MRHIGRKPHVGREHDALTYCQRPQQNVVLGGGGGLVWVGWYGWVGMGGLGWVGWDGWVGMGGLNNRTTDLAMQLK